MVLRRQANLVIWKAWLAKRRAPSALLIELVVPTLVVMLMVAVRVISPPARFGFTSYAPMAMPSAGPLASLSGSRFGLGCPPLPSCMSRTVFEPNGSTA